eukprot:SAG31_NODE_195_length_20708_cov_9.627638_17_plen_106_part_00
MRCRICNVLLQPFHDSEDGIVRIYEAVDVMNLGHWPLSEEFLVDKAGVSCIAWNQSGGRTADEAPSLVVASGETRNPVVKVNFLRTFSCANDNSTFFDTLAMTAL